MMAEKDETFGFHVKDAANELGLTPVTIRRYMGEFNLQTIYDAHGIKLLTAGAMKELREIRAMKEKGLSNPEVLKKLEETRV